MVRSSLETDGEIHSETEAQKSRSRCILRRRDGRVAEGARLESVFRGNSNVGSNPTLSASFSKP